MGTSRDQSVPVGSGDGLNISAGGNIYGRIDTIRRPAFAQYQLWRTWETLVFPRTFRATRHGQTGAALTSVLFYTDV